MIFAEKWLWEKHCLQPYLCGFAVCRTGVYYPKSEAWLPGDHGPHVPEADGDPDEVFGVNGICEWSGAEGVGGTQLCFTLTLTLQFAR